MVGLRLIPLHMMCMCYLLFSGVALLVLFLVFNSTDTEDNGYYYEYYDQSPYRKQNMQQEADNGIPPEEPEVLMKNPDADLEGITRDKILAWIEDMHPKKSDRMWDTIAVSCNEINITGIASSKDFSSDCHPLQKLLPDIKVCLPRKERSERGDWDSMFLITTYTLMQMFPKLGLIDVNADLGAFSLLAASLKRNTITIESEKVRVDSIARSVLINGDAKEHVTLLHNVLVPGEPTKEAWNANNSKSVPSIVMSDLLEVVPFSYAILRLDIVNAEHRALVKGGDFLERVMIPFILIDWQDLRDRYKADIPEFIAFLTSRFYEPFRIFLDDVESKVDAEKLDIGDWNLWPDRMLWKSDFQ